MSDAPGEQYELPTEDEQEMDPALLAAALEELKSEQNLIAGIAAGLAAAIVGAGVWAAVTVVTEYQIGWMAVGVGFLVGIAIRTMGKGLDTLFGVAGALLALLGCVLGNFFTIVYFVGQSENLGFMEVLPQINLAAVPEIMMATFSPMDILFYGIAIYEGYKLSFRQITHEELDTAIRGSAASI